MKNFFSEILCKCADGRYSRFFVFLFEIVRKKNGISREMNF